jgi:hypothetical protein
MAMVKRLLLLAKTNFSTHHSPWRITGPNQVCIYGLSASRQNKYSLKDPILFSVLIPLHQGPNPALTRSLPCLKFTPGFQR